VSFQHLAALAHSCVIKAVPHHVDAVGADGRDDVTVTGESLGDVVVARVVPQPLPPLATGPLRASLELLVAGAVVAVHEQHEWIGCPGRPRRVVHLSGQLHLSVNTRRLKDLVAEVVDRAGYIVGAARSWRSGPGTYRRAADTLLGFHGHDGFAVVAHGDPVDQDRAIGCERAHRALVNRGDTVSARLTLDDYDVAKSAWRKASGHRDPVEIVRDAESLSEVDGLDLQGGATTDHGPVGFHGRANRIRRQSLRCEQPGAGRSLECGRGEGGLYGQR